MAQRVETRRESLKGAGSQNQQQKHYARFARYYEYAHNLFVYYKHITRVRGTQTLLALAYRIYRTLLTNNVFVILVFFFSTWISYRPAII